MKLYDFKILMYNLIVKSHHMQFTQIHYAGSNVRWSFVQYLLLKHLDQMQTVYASAVLEV